MSEPHLPGPNLGGSRTKKIFGESVSAKKKKKEKAYKLGHRKRKESGHTRATLFKLYITHGNRHKLGYGAKSSSPKFIEVNLLAAMSYKLSGVHRRRGVWCVTACRPQSELTKKNINTFGALLLIAVVIMVTTKDSNFSERKIKLSFRSPK